MCWTCAVNVLGFVLFFISVLVFSWIHLKFVAHVSTELYFCFLFFSSSCSHGCVGVCVCVSRLLRVRCVSDHRNVCLALREMWLLLSCSASCMCAMMMMIIIRVLLYRGLFKSVYPEYSFVHIWFLCKFPLWRVLSLSCSMILFNSHVVETEAEYALYPQDC